MRGKIKNGRYIIELCGIAFLLLFPLRHAGWGLDLWDTGYNYANFTYASPENMGIMWWFSTYFANLIGHFLTLLPLGNTLLGLNVYTGLVVSLLSISGYYFCTRKLKIARGCVFAGELIALCLCWCPTAKLYDYLTFLLFELCVMFLYTGLTEQKRGALLLAGVCLGANIFVRFSNLPEAGLILAVWGYALLERLEKKNGGKGKAAIYTLWCLAGYLIPLILVFVWIAIRYGIGEYIEGIRLLFAMTESAEGYQASSMLYGLFWPFREGKYWVFRILVFVIAASLSALAADYAPLYFEKKGRFVKVFPVISRVGTVFFSLILAYWLLTKEKPSFTSEYFQSYDPIYWPAVLFIMLALGMGGIQILRRRAAKEERLLGALLILMLLLTSLGSNNGIMPSINNLFLAAPYVLYQLVRFTRWSYERELRQKPKDWTDFRLNFIPAAFMSWVLVLLMMIPFGMFGLKFAFCEGTGIQKRGYVVENNPVLWGVDMSYGRAVALSKISAYAAENDFAGQEVILYGYVPSLSFYLQMPPAFQAWSDLESYHYSTMRGAVEELAGEIAEKGRKKPVVIAGKKGADFSLGLGREELEGRSEDPKWLLIWDFMERWGYKKTYENEMFVIWQAR